MILGYNSNGIANHDPVEAIQLLSEIGYRSIAITVDHGFLNPFDEFLEDNVANVKQALEANQMSCVIESGARYLLDPRRKHQPTMLSETESGREQRSDFIRRCIDLADELSAGCVSLWSGSPTDHCDDQAALDRLKTELEPLIEYADSKNQVLGFEPEPDMFIDTLASFGRLLQWVDSPALQLTLDIGHLFCQGEVPVVDYIEKWRDRIVNVHIEDIKAGVHEHLMFGDGEIHFPPIIDKLIEIEFEGPVHVELSRHSHCAPAAARESYEFLIPLVEQAQSKFHKP